MARVVVVGAGYAGVMAANRLATVGRSAASVTVVNPRPEFVERVRLHEHAVGVTNAVRPLSGLLHRDVRLRVAAVEAIDERSVRLDDGGALDFDYLLYAVGSTAARGVAGAENAWSIADLDGAESLRTRLRHLAAGARVVVVGGGLTGIESAAEIAYRYPTLHVELVSRSVAAGLPDTSRAALERKLVQAGVLVRTGLRVTGVRPDGVDTAAGRLPSDCTVWAGSFDVPDLALRSGLPVTSDGRLRTDETLVCTGHRRIVGVGDAVAPPAHVGGHLRMSCQAAMPLGAHGADTVLALIRGERPAPVSIGMVGQGISLGRRDGFVQATHRDDTPRGFVLSGRAAAVVKERVCRFTVAAMRFPRAYRWLPGAVPTGSAPPRPQPDEQRSAFRRDKSSRPDPAGTTPTTWKRKEHQHEGRHRVRLRVAWQYEEDRRRHGPRPQGDCGRP
ncbi:putative oxidoreductase [Streptomyces sp. NBRC 110611]|uniref:NAD(P)/FAD-dependent oxidoreductase n=1 Tax=Streptomyces sp. NBRC 110611 TaxID=1621259 RepID=UPI0008563F3A|nr:FAD-dependent oxidoreductase [Streptomyces sp. NBRC 110611]GAU69304.1 putative oxidoreductase [Streptomyces sp. NBRC 110611]